MTKRLSEWRRVEMRGCGHARQRRDLKTYTRQREDGRQVWGHEHHPGEVAPCGTKVELR